MNKKINEVINKYYMKENKNEYLKRIHNNNPIINELLNCKYKDKIKLYDKDNPYILIQITFDKFEKNNLKINYSTILKISKLTKVYYLQHEFAVESADPETLTPDLDGFGTQAYCFQQLYFEEFIQNILNNNEYEQLYIYDLEERVLVGKTIVSVENVLFIPKY